MEHDSRNNTGSSTFGYGAGPSWMDRLEQVGIPQHSTLQGANPLDLPSAIAHELQRSQSTPPGWQHAWSHPSPLELGKGFRQQQQLPFGAFLSQDGNLNASRGLSLPPYYIPRFEEASGPAALLHHQQTGLQDYSTESASAHQGLFSRSSELPSQPHGRVHSSMRVAACSPSIERMMQADVTPTPCPSLGISTSLSLAQRAVGDGSCAASATLDLHSDLQQWSENQSMSSAFNCDALQQRESTVEASTDLCTDDEDLETRPVDEKRKRRMLSNRASAQRSRQRRQERLDQLEVLTAQLRVENSTLQKKLRAVIEVAKNLEDQNTNLLKKVDTFTKELDIGKPKKVVAAAAFDECASSQQTTCASSCEMVGSRTSVDPNSMREGNENDGASMSAGSPGRPSGSCPNENEIGCATSNVNNNNNTNNNNRKDLSPVRRAFSACRVGKKRSLDESGIAGGASFGESHSPSMGNHMGLASAQPNRPRPSLTGSDTHGFPEPSGAFANTFGLDPTLEAEHWLEFAECFK